MKEVSSKLWMWKCEAVNDPTLRHLTMCGPLDPRNDLQKMNGSKLRVVVVSMRLITDYALVNILFVCMDLYTWDTFEFLCLSYKILLLSFI